jgi:CDP-paratose 2-epimerase
MSEFIQSPRCGEVYNIGGGKENSISMMEAFSLTEQISGKPMKYKYSSQHREGDHIVYYSDLSKMKLHYPKWTVSKDLSVIFSEIVESWKNRITSNR